MLAGQLKIHSPALIILLFSMIVGIMVHDDYGISWDEQSQRTIGLKSWGYMFDDDNSYESFHYKEYGVAFEVPLIQLEKMLSLDNPADIYRMRHLVTHFFFLFSGFVFYLLIWFIHKNRLLALTGYLMLLLSPRIYAHSFFNTKDIPFMGMFILCFFLAALAFARKKHWYFLLYGIFAGLLVNIRVMGVLLPAITVVFLLIDTAKGADRIKTMVSLVVFLFAASLTLFVTWPYLWSDPVGNFSAAFVSMSKYRWDNYVLMFGRFVRSTEIGWWYFPAWFLITIPVVYLLSGLAGIVILLFRFFKSPLPYLLNTPERNQFLHLICLAAPVSAVIILHSVLYDTWRQLFFIYPMFLMMAVYALSYAWKKPDQAGSLLQLGIPAIMIISFCFTALFMIRNHPFQDVYFNRLVSHKEEYLRKNFEMNFWGNAYNKALEQILTNDERDHIFIMAANMPGEHNLMLFNVKERERVTFVYSPAKADYYMTNYRWHPDDYAYMPATPFYSIRVHNSTIISVWKLR